MDGPRRVDEEGGTRVLVAGKDAAVCAAASAALTHAGYEVQTGGDPAVGLVHATEARPAVIVVDGWGLEPRGRAALAAYGRRRGPHAPVLLVAGGPETELLDAAAEVDAAGVLHLPLDPHVLLETVSRLTRAAPFPAKDDGDELARRRHLRHLSGEVATLRDELLSAAAEAQRLLEQIAREGRVARLVGTAITLDTALRLRALRRDRRRLELRLRHATREYEALRGARRR